MWFVLALSPLIAYILIVIVKEIAAYRSLAFYKRQGIKTIYKFVAGGIYFLTKPMGSLDQLERLKKLYKEESDRDLVVFNDMATTGSFILLISREMMQEFFKNETKISKKTAFFKTASLGFIDHGGERAMKKRALFKKFFH